MLIANRISNGFVLEYSNIFIDKSDGELILVPDSLYSEFIDSDNYDFVRTIRCDEKIQILTI